MSAILTINGTKSWLGFKFLSYDKDDKKFCSDDFFFPFGKNVDEGFLNPTRSLEALPRKPKKLEKMNDEDYKEMDEKVVNSIHLNVSK